MMQSYLNRRKVKPFTHRLVALSSWDNVAVTLGKYGEGDAAWMNRDIKWYRELGYKSVRIEEMDACAVGVLPSHSDGTGNP